MEGSLTKPVSSTTKPMPSLVSRLDRLDSMMRHLEAGIGSKKDGSSRWRGDDTVEDEVVEIRQAMPLDLAVKEAQSKGSILDRITALEDRLVQLFLDIESEATSPSKGSEMEEEQAYLGTTSQGSIRKGLSHSFSKFRSSSHENKQPFDKLRAGERKEQMQRRRHSEPSSERKSRDHVDAKTSQKLKKNVPHNWLHLRLLGC